MGGMMDRYVFTLQTSMPISYNLNKRCSDYYITYRGWIYNVWRHRAHWRAGHAPHTYNCRCLPVINLPRPHTQTHRRTDRLTCSQTGARTWRIGIVAASFTVKTSLR